MPLLVVRDADAVAAIVTEGEVAGLGASASHGGGSGKPQAMNSRPGELGRGGCEAARTCNGSCTTALVVGGCEGALDPIEWASVAGCDIAKSF